MTEYIPQTSASDRYAAARDALKAWDDFQPTMDHAHALAETLRALVTPPGVHESEESIATGIHGRYLRAEFDGDFQYAGEPMRNALTAAVRAGIQSAHETWECEVALRPTQEQMLRWLGIEYADSDDGERLIILSDTIDREED